MPRPLSTHLFAVAFVVVLPAVTLAQSAVISGIVRGEDDEPVEDATVVAQSAPSDRAQRTTETHTNDSGRFSFIGLRPGRWIFSILKDGYQPTQGLLNVRRSGRSNMSFVLEFDTFNPPPPATGPLAGIRAAEVQEVLQRAHGLFDEGDFDGAIGAYEGLLERIPALTSLHLQIGQAHQAKGDVPRALASYRAVPPESPAAGEAALAIDQLDGP